MLWGAPSGPPKKLSTCLMQNLFMLQHYFSRLPFFSCRRRDSSSVPSRCRYINAMATAKDEKDFIVPKDSTPRGNEGSKELALAERANASGHVQELDRNFNLLNAVGVGLLVCTVWPAFGGTILTSLVFHSSLAIICELTTW